MKNLTLTLLFLLTLSGCYTTFNIPSSRVTSSKIVGITSEGDTVQVHYNTFNRTYITQPSVYSDWRFYYDGRWYPSNMYYSYFTQPIIYNTPVVIYQNPSKRITKIRTSGKTSKVSTSERVKNKPRSTGRSSKKDSSSKKRTRN